MLLPDDLWRAVQRSMPIACVDLVVTAPTGEVLMLLRRNPPAQWWLPGGRVWHRERRVEAARRKLREECGLEAVSDFEEWATHDIIFDDAPEIAHGITTVFRVRVPSTGVTLDRQSERFDWRTPRQWLATVEHPLLRHVLERAAEER